MSTIAHLSTAIMTFKIFALIHYITSQSVLFIFSIHGSHSVALVVLARRDAPCQNVHASAVGFLVRDLVACTYIHLQDYEPLPCRCRGLVHRTFETAIQTPQQNLARIINTSRDSR